MNNKNISKFPLSKKGLMMILATAGAMPIAISMPSDASAGAIFSSGTGTVADPYIITTAEQLDAVRNFQSAHFKLGNNIDLSGYSAGEGWLPIDFFEGTLDGAGHKIKNLKIYRPNTQFVGLFGELGNSNLKNIYLENVDIKGWLHVGGLAGYSSGSVSHCFISGTVAGKYQFGGLVGTNEGLITSSYSAANVGLNSDAKNNFGGIVGINIGTISNSYAIGRVGGAAAADITGGIVAVNNVGTVVDSYYDQTTTGQSDTGKGIGKTTVEMKQQATYVGWDFANTWTIQEGVGYPTLRVFNNNSDQLPVASNVELTGTAEVGSTLTATYTYTDADGDLETDTTFAFYSYDSNGIYNKTLVQPASAVNTYVIKAADAGKVIKVEVIPKNEKGTGAAVSSAATGIIKMFTGTGTVDDPYLITTADQLNALNLREYSDKNFKLVNDIDLSSYSNWQPISSGFKGTLNGNDKTIRNLTITESRYQNTGLFITLQDATIKNLTIDGVNIDLENRLFQSYSVGTLAASSFSSTIENVHVTNGTVSGSRTAGFSGNGSLGGLLGYAYQTTITNATSAVSVVGDLNNSSFDDGTGGLIGVLDSGTVNKVHFTGGVTGHYNVGGLFGKVGFSSKVNNAIANGTVKGVSNVGGLIGCINDASSTLGNSYASGEVTGTYNPGGIVGYTTTYGGPDLTKKRFNNLYWNQSTTKQARGIFDPFDPTSVEYGKSIDSQTWLQELELTSDGYFALADITIGTEIPFNAYKGQEFEVPVSISNIPSNISSYDMILDFAKDKFQVISISPINTNAFSSFDNQKGLISVGWPDLTSTLNPLTGVEKQQLFTIKFKAKNEAYSGDMPIILSATQSSPIVLKNDNNKRVLANVIAGKIAISEAPSLSYSSTTFVEAAANDGSISTTPITITLTNDTFTGTDGEDFATNNKLEVENLPEGLSLSAIRTTANQLAVTLTGKATNHANSNDISNIKLSFKDTAFTNGTTSIVQNTTMDNLAIDFADGTAEIKIGEVAAFVGEEIEVPVSITKLSSDIAAYGIFIDFDKEALEVVDVSPAIQDDIGFAYNAINDEGVLRTTWVDMSGGDNPIATTQDLFKIKFKVKAGATTGEKALTISAATDEFPVPLEFTGSDLNNIIGTVTEGEVSVRKLIYSDTKFVEAEANNGTFTTPITITLENDTFVGTDGDDFTEYLDWDSTKLPAGLSISAERTSANQIEVSLIGNATNHLDVNDVTTADNLRITLKDQAFTKGNTAVVKMTTSDPLEIDFSNPTAKIAIGSITGFAGDVVEIPVSISSITSNVKSFNLNLEYDQNVLDYVTFTKKTTVSKYNIGIENDEENGKLSITGLGNTALSTLQELIAIKFKIKETASSGDTSITLDTDEDYTSEFTDSFGENVIVDVTEGTVTITTAPSLSYSGSKFYESDLNDGSISTTPITITLANDTFTGVDGEDFAATTSGKLQVTNLPANLQLHAIRTSANQLELSLSGTATKHENIHDVNNLTIAFLNSAFTNGKASIVNNAIKNDLQIDFFDPAPILTYYGDTFVETEANDGTIQRNVKDFQNPLKITLKYDTFTGNDGDNFTDKVLIEGVPDGLQAKVIRESSTSLYVTLEGEADNHSDIDDTDNLTISFPYDSAFTSGNAAKVTNSSKSGVKIDFADPRTLTYSSLIFKESEKNDGTISTTPITITIANDTFTGNSDEDFVATNKLKVTNLPDGLTAKAIRTSGTELQVTLEGAVANHLNVNDVNNLTFTFDKTAFTKGDISEVVNSTKNDLQIDFADVSGLTYLSTVFTESEIDDGSIATTAITIELSDDQFTGNDGDDFVALEKLEVSNLPDGLTAVAQRISNTVLEVKLTGKASKHLEYNNVDDLTFTFNNGAFVSGDATKVQNATKDDLKIEFIGIASLTYVPATFMEADSNDGSISTTPITITLDLDEFNGTTGEDFVASDKVNVLNVPAGLTPVATLINEKQINLQLTGNADNHGLGNNVNNIKVEFLDNAFINAPASVVQFATKDDISIEYLNNEPSITLIDSNEDQIVNADGKVILAGTATDVNAGQFLSGSIGQDILNVTATIDGKQKTTPVDALGNWELEWEGSELSEGTYTNIDIVVNDGSSTTNDSVSITYTGTILVDKVAPKINKIQKSVSQATNQYVAIAVDASDDVSGIAEKKFALGTDVDYAQATTFDGLLFNVELNGTYTVWVRDKAGNTISDTVVVTEIDPVAVTKAALEIGYATGDSVNAVTQDVTLASTGADGTTITWNSDTPRVIANNGTVTRPANSAGDASVTLTATITKGGVTETKVFVVKVLKQSQTDAEAVSNAKVVLEIGYATGDSINAVTQSVMLPTMGADGATITWNSDTPSVIRNDGTVTRPANSAGDASVTLTATITKGNETTTKVFVVKVLKQSQTDVEAVTNAKAALEIGYATGDSVNAVTQDVTLASTGVDGTTITWNSDTPSVIGNDGTVTRPANSAGDASVTLTATITKGTETTTKVFVVKVLKQSQTDAEAVSNAKVALEIGYATGDSVNAVTQDVTLASTGVDGATITWNSDTPSVIGNDGTVTRPANSAGDASVTLTATITKGTETTSKVFVVKVLKQSQTDAEAVSNAKATLEIGYSTGDSVNAVTQDVTLASTGVDGATITWNSDTPSVIGNDGTVSRPANSAGDASVTLTATITKGGVTETKVFVVKVLKQSQTDVEAVTNAKAALEIGYGTGDSINAVTQSVILPTTGADGTTITWASDATNVIGVDGTVSRPANSAGDVSVTLTATITKGGVTETKVFVVKVLKQSQIDVEAVSNAKAALEIGYATGDSINAVTQSVMLPIMGADGTTITWNSDTPSVIANDGTVTRPANSAGDASVTLTATITKGTETTNKVFVVKVLKQSQTDAEAVTNAKAALEIGYGTGDSINAVTQSVTLPTTGADGTTITWASDATNVIGLDGTVIRPTNGAGDASVTLTATITKGGVSTTKVFVLKVLKLHDIDAPQISYTPPTTWTNRPLLVTPIITDSGSGIASTKWAVDENDVNYFLSNGTSFSDSFEVAMNGTYTVYAQDVAGNQSVYTFTVGNIDTTLPTLDVSVDNTATNDKVLIAVDGSDQDSGVEIIKWLEGTRIAGDFKDVGSLVVDGSFAVTENGNYTVYIRDVAGNEVVETVEVSSIDNELPVILVDVPTEWTTGDVTISATVREKGGSIATTRWAVGEQDASYFSDGSGYELTPFGIDSTFTRQIAETTVGELNPEETSQQDSIVDVADDALSGGAPETPTDEQSEGGAPETPTDEQSEGGAPETPTDDQVEEGTPEVPADEQSEEKVPETPADEQIGEENAPLAPEAVIEPVLEMEIPELVPMLRTMTSDVIELNYQFTVSENNTYTIYTKDDAGNEQIAHVTVGNIDNTAPVVTATVVDHDAINFESTIAVDIDENQSGIKEKKWAKGTLLPSDFAALGTELVGTTFNVHENGTYTVYVKDNAGNESVGYVIVETITLPSIQIELLPLSTNDGTKVSVSIGNTSSQIVEKKWLKGNKTKFDFVNDGNGFTGNDFIISEEGIYTVYIKDASGNEVIKTFVYQTKPYQIEGSLSNSGGIKAAATISLQDDTNPTSGTKYVVFQLMKGTTPVSVVAIEKTLQATENVSAYFNVTGSGYTVIVNVLDKDITNQTDVGRSLADSKTLTIQN
ncbi:cohesin domain-containing protein [Schinkia azotoformans]|nr:immunoglobulin-like domain-containing protein [Schinkia azotoformans]MEC1639559.1 cohesin domain-containing protein [Schinkia azotoformans]MEC1944697.1 cohesin domain-containing protein [Schinkia azotoformans]